MKSKLLLLILLLGSFIRLYRLGEIPVSLYWDEVAIGYDAYSISQTGNDMHGNSFLQTIFPSYGDYKLPMYIWIDAFFVKVFGLAPWVVRLPSALAGIAIIALTYAVAQRLFSDRKQALWSAVAVALMPVDILFSRTGFEGHLAVVFILLAIYLWLGSFTRWWLHLPAAFFAAAAVYSYFAARIVLPLIAAVTLVAFWRSTTWQWKITFVGSLGIWLLLLVPIFRSPYYPASNQFRLSTLNVSDTGQFALQSNILREQSGNSPINRIIYHRYFLQSKAILTNIAAHLDPNFLFISGDSNLRHSTNRVGLMFYSWLPIFIIGFIYVLKHKFSVALWLFGCWVASIIPAAIPVEVPHALRSLTSVMVFPLILGAGIQYLSRKHKIISLVILSGFLIEFMLFAHDYLNHYPRRSASVWQSGYMEVASYLTSRQDTFNSCTVNYPDQRLYLYFLFADQTSPKNIQTNTDYQLKKFSKFSFTPDINNTDCLVVSPALWEDMGKPDAVTIPDAAGIPQFYIMMNTSP